MSLTGWTLPSPGERFAAHVSSLGGRTELELGASELEELDRLAPRSVGPGSVYPMACSVTRGKTLPLGERR